MSGDESTKSSEAQDTVLKSEISDESTKSSSDTVPKSEPSLVTEPQDSKDVPTMSEYVTALIGMFDWQIVSKWGTVDSVKRIRDEFKKFAIRGVASFTLNHSSEEVIRSWLRRTYAAMHMALFGIHWNHVTKYVPKKEDFEGIDPETDTAEFRKKIEDIMKEAEFPDAAVEGVRDIVKTL